MEILRFDEVGSSTPQRKKSSKGMLVVGLVATLFGISSAFASSTITINGSQGVSLGQGVTLAAACDSEISVVPITAMTLESGVPKFYLTKIQFNGIDTDTGTPTSSPPTYGCGGKTFDIQIFNPKTSIAYTCGQLEEFGSAIAYEGNIDDTNDVLTDCADGIVSFQISNAFDGDRNYQLVFNKAPSDLSYITLVTRES
jgi:hypothetical protein